MKLDEFHINHFASSTPRCSEPIACRYFWVGGTRIDASKPPCCENRGFGVNSSYLFIYNRGNTVACNGFLKLLGSLRIRQEIDGKGIL